MLTPYLKLVQAFPLRPLRSNRDLDRAIKIVDSLLDRDRLTKGEMDYLDILVDIINRYETEHYPMDSVPGREMIKFLMKARGITQSDVAAGTGISVSTISEILNEKRKLNIGHIKLLSEYFQVKPGLFI